MALELTGRVVDATGRGVGRARVGLGARPEPTDPAVVAGEDGSFRASLRTAGLGATGVLVLVAEAPGFEPTRLAVRPEGRRFDVGEVVVHPSTVVAARVLDRDGAAVVGSEVSLLGRDDAAADFRRTAGATTGAGGRVALAGPARGLWSVVVVGPGHAALTTEPFEFPGEGPIDLGTLTVDRGGRASGRVVDRQGRGIEGVRLDLIHDQAAPAGSPCDDVARRLALVSAHEDRAVMRLGWARSGRDGSFEVLGLGASRHALVLEHPDFAGAAVQGVQAGATDLLIELAPSSATVVAVTDPSGRSPDDVRVVAHPLLGGLALAEELPVSTTAAGFRIGDVGSCGVEVVVSSPGLATARRRLAGAGPHAVVLEREAQVAGLVSGRGGRPVADALVEARVEARVGDHPEAVITATDAQGRYRVGGLPAGDVSLTIRHPAHVPGRLDVVAPTLGADVVLVQVGRVLVTVVDHRGVPSPGRSLRLESGRGEARRKHVARTDANGQATLELAPGAWAFALHDGHPIDVREGEEQAVTLVTPAPAVVEGWVSHGGEPVAGATVIAFSEEGAVARGSARTDDQGAWSLCLDPGRYRFLATGPDSRPGRSPMAARTVPAGGAVVVDLAFGTGSIEGVVSPWDGSLPEAWVELLPCGEPSVHHETLGTRTVGGSFSFPAVPSGEYRLRASSDGSLPGAEVLVDLPAGQHRSDVVVTVVATGCVQGLVVDRAGVPVADGCELRLSSDRGVRRTVTFEGRFSRSHLVAGPWTVEVLCPSSGDVLASAPFRVDAGRVSRVRLVVEDH